MRRGASRSREQAHDALRGPLQAEWIERLDAEADNLRAALAWATARPSQHDAALTIAAKLWRYWHLTGRMTEGRALVARALAATADDPALPARADALYAAGALAKNQSDLMEAACRLDEACAAFQAQGRERDAAAALGSLGNVRQDQGDLATARALHARAHDLFCRVGDRTAEATALLNLGSICVDLSEWDAALQYHERSLALARQLGLGTVECMGEANLGELALRRGDPGAARPHFERALALARRIHFRVVEATALTNLASLALADGDHAAARPLARDAIVILAEAGSKAALIEALETAAELCVRDGAAVIAARVLAATAAARAELALPLLPQARRRRERVQALLEASPPRGPVSALAFADAVGATLAELGDVGQSGSAP